MRFSFFPRPRFSVSVAAAFALGVAVGRWGRVPDFRRDGPWPSIAAQGVLEKPEGLFVQTPDDLPSVPVLSVVDGDTLEVLWRGQPKKLRYYGVNTPERDQPCYDVATARNRALAGGAVRLAFDERREDKYNRLLAYVFTDDGRSIDAALTAEGVGRAWRRDGAWRDRIVRLEAEARAARRGCLWEGGTEAPPTRRRRRSR